MQSEERRKPPRKKMTGFEEFLVMNLGILLLTAGVYFFKIPNGFSTGGVSGISTVLGKLFPNLSTGTFILIINTALLLIGLLVIGREFGIKTVYCSFAFSGATMLFEWLLPMNGPLTHQPFMELVYAILLTSIGSALLFYVRASSGGTDIVAMILKKFTSLDIGKALLVTDVLVAAAAFPVFGVEAGLFSLLGLFAKAFLVDGVIESIGACKFFTIVTTHKEEVRRYILENLHHGVTELEGHGGYTGEEKTVLLTVCKRIEGVRLRRYVRLVDPHAFLVVTNSSEIIGKGFRAV